MELKSPAFGNGEKIPQKYTGDGADVSPPLEWTDPPAGTLSFALICDDPDAPKKTWTHWVIANIPADRRSLEEGVPANRALPSGAVQGQNDFGKIGYGGPAPPKGKPHRYFFRLYALNEHMLGKAGATKDELLKAMEGHILGEAQWMGTYQR